MKIEDEKLDQKEVLRITDSDLADLIRATRKYGIPKSEIIRAGMRKEIALLDMQSEMLEVIEKYFYLIPKK